MKMNNMIKRILCLALCLCMAVGMLAVATSCGDEDIEVGETNDAGEVIVEEKEEGEVAVVKVLKEIKAGEKLTSENVGIGYAKEDDIPINAVRTTSNIINKYADTILYKGEFVFLSKLSANEPTSINPGNTDALSYIVVSTHVEDGKDATAAIQKLIDENPGRTLYFPEGTYTISKSLKTPSDPAKAVSFRFSNYAKLVASSSWSGNTAMICIGAGAKATDVQNSTDTYINGGIIDGGGKAAAISIDNGRDIRLHDVSITNATVGVTISTGDMGAVNVDMDNIDITGASADTSKGIVINGGNNSITNVRIYNVHKGVELSESSFGNTLTDVHVMYPGTNADSYGFYDNADGKHTPNTFNMCTAQNFGTGFRMGTKAVSIFEECNVYFTKAQSQQVGFGADQKFNGVINGCKVVIFSKTTSAFLRVGSGGGAGKITFPIIDGVGKLSITTHNDYNVGTKIEY